MDILDEIDAVIQEKKSKWKYTPMREKSETDAIIDELLREFPSDSYEGSAGERAMPRVGAEPAAVHEQPAEPETEREIEPYVYNEEQLERQRYERSLEEENADNSAEKYIEPEIYSDVTNDDDTVPYDYNEPEEYSAEPEITVEPDINYEPEADNYIEYSDDSEAENEPENDAAETDNVSEDDSVQENIRDGNSEYNEYISHKYTTAKYEEEEEEKPLYNDDEYDGEDDEDFTEFEEEMPENSGKKKNTDKDFNNFMDSANDGEKGDIPKFSVSSAVFTVFKILLLAAFGALAVVGIINIASVGVDKYNNSKGKSDSLLKGELQSVIYPVVVTETADFKNLSELTNEQIINIAVWDIVINGNKSSYLDSDTGEFYLPQEDMTANIERLFGAETGFKHASSGIGDKKIVFDGINKRYILPEDTDLYTLRPVVTDVAQTGDVFAVYADCYRSNPSWSNVKSDQPVKRVIVTLKKTSDHYNITELKTIPLN